MTLTVKDEWVEKAHGAFRATAKSRPLSSAVRAALTAILPDIEREVRERCAKVAETTITGSGLLMADSASQTIASAIRGGSHE